MKAVTKSLDLLFEMFWMYNIILIFLALSVLHLGVPYAYYVYLRHIVKKQTRNVLLDRNYEPRVTMIIPAYNESSAIIGKLKSLLKLDYPRDKLDIIIVDSASTDNTAQIARSYLEKNGFPFKTLVLEEETRRGKGEALNLALTQATGEIIATSDADSYWAPSALREGLSYMAGLEVGAVTGREVLRNLDRNTFTLAEGMYRNVYNTLRAGESLLHSTLIFQGELSLYRRQAFEKFETERGSDDTGTVVNILSRNYRCIFASSAVFYDTAPSSLRDRITVKTRRAQHLIYALFRAAILKINGRFRVPAVTVFANFFLHIVNPFLGIALLIAALYVFYAFPFLLLIAPLPFLVKKVRILFVSYLTSNIALLFAVFRCLKGDKQTVWKKIRKQEDAVPSTLITN